MDTDNNPSERVAVQTAHVDAMVVAAWNADARRMGRTLEAVAREHLGIPAGQLVVVAVDMTHALERRIQAGLAKPGMPWPELLQAAFEDSLRRPQKWQS